jgi:hypothetical protein
MSSGGGGGGLASAAATAAGAAAAATPVGRALTAGAAAAGALGVGAAAASTGSSATSSSGSTGSSATSPTGSTGGGGGSFSGSSASARKAAEEYLGRPMSDEEFDELVRATNAEAGRKNQTETAMVAATILNRARDKKKSVSEILREKNQFQAVTGTRQQPGPHENFTSQPGEARLNQILGGMEHILPHVSKNQTNFTAANEAAYGPGTNIGFRDKMIDRGGSIVGGSVFNTTPPKIEVPEQGQQQPQSQPQQGNQSSQPRPEQSQNNESGVRLAPQSYLQGYDPNKDYDLPRVGNATPEYAEENFMPGMNFIGGLGFSRAIGENPYVRQGIFHPSGKTTVSPGHSAMGHHYGRHGALAADISSGKAYRPAFVKQIGSQEASLEVNRALGDLLFSDKMRKELRPREMINQGRKVGPDGKVRPFPKSPHPNHVHFAPGFGVTKEDYDRILKRLFEDPSYYGEEGVRFAKVMEKHGLWKRNADGTYRLNEEKYPELKNQREEPEQTTDNQRPEDQPAPQPESSGQQSSLLGDIIGAAQASESDQKNIPTQEQINAEQERIAREKLQKDGKSYYDDLAPPELGKLSQEKINEIGLMSDAQLEEISKAFTRSDWILNPERTAARAELKRRKAQKPETKTRGLGKDLVPEVQPDQQFPASRPARFVTLRTKPGGRTPSVPNSHDPRPSNEPYKNKRALLETHRKLKALSRRSKEGNKPKTYEPEQDYDKITYSRGDFGATPGTEYAADSEYGAV